MNLCNTVPGSSDTVNTESAQKVEQPHPETGDTVEKKRIVAFINPTTAIESHVDKIITKEPVYRQTNSLNEQKLKIDWHEVGEITVDLVIIAALFYLSYRIEGPFIAIDIVMYCIAGLIAALLVGLVINWFFGSWINASGNPH